MQRLLWVMSCGSGDRCLFSPDTGSSVQRWLTCTKQPSSAPTIGKSAACWPEWRRSVNRCSALRPKEQLRPPTRPRDMSRTKIRTKDRTSLQSTTSPGAWTTGTSWRRTRKRTRSTAERLRPAAGPRTATLSAEPHPQMHPAAVRVGCPARPQAPAERLSGSLGSTEKPWPSSRLWSCRPPNRPRSSRPISTWAQSRPRSSTRPPAPSPADTCPVPWSLAPASTSARWDPPLMSLCTRTAWPWQQLRWATAVMRIYYGTLRTAATQSLWSRTDCPLRLPPLWTDWPALALSPRATTLTLGGTGHVEHQVACECPAPPAAWRPAAACQTAANWGQMFATRSQTRPSTARRLAQSTNQDRSWASLIRRPASSSSTVFPVSRVTVGSTRFSQSTPRTTCSVTTWLPTTVSHIMPKRWALTRISTSLCRPTPPWPWVTYQTAHTSSQTSSAKRGTVTKSPSRPWLCLTPTWTENPNQALSGRILPSTSLQWNQSDPSSSPMCRYLTLVHNAQTAKIWWTFSFGNSCSKGSSPCSVTYDMFHVVRPSWRRCTEGSFLACSVQHNYGSKHFIHVCAAQSAYVIQFQCPVFKRKCTLCSFCPRCWGEKWGRCKKV